MERSGDAVDCSLRCSTVERTFASHEGGRIKVAKNDVGVGDRRLDAAIAITSRPRDGAGTLRTHPQGSPAVDLGDGSSTGRDAGNVQAAQGNALPGQHSVC